VSTPEILDNFFSALVGEIRARKPDYLREPFTVAEIYQNLVPYRTHRDRIGVEMNADYEDALLRLLAGEGDLLVLESDTARGEIETELRSSNPNTLMYRDYAAAMVRLNPALAVDPTDAIPADSPRAALAPDDADSSESRSAGSGPRSPVGIEELAPSEPESTTEGPEKATADAILEDLIGADHVSPPGGESAAPKTATPKTAMPKTATPETALPKTAMPATPSPQRVPSESGNPDNRCQSCLGELPGRAVLNFCPLCGADLRTPACPSCGEELEPEWRFCVVCGTKAPEQ
jgi:hypothetical protein